MKKLGTIAGIAFVAVVIVAYTFFFTVEEGKQVVITQFGDPVHVVTEAGLSWRWPLIQQVNVLELCKLPWVVYAENIQTRDKMRIYVAVWARWRIDVPTTFFRAVRTEDGGQHSLDSIVDSAVQDVVARNNMIDLVRNSNDPLFHGGDDIVRDQLAKREEVTTGRAQMEREILERARAGFTEKYGIELSGVHIKRVMYVDSVRDAVFDRMRSERMRIAMLFEAEAEEEKNRILGLTQKEIDQIEGEMERQAAEIRGTADAEVIRIAAEAFGRSPEFYAFLKRLELLKQSLGRDTRVVLSTDTELFRLLKSDSAEPPETP